MTRDVTHRNVTCRGHAGPARPLPRTTTTTPTVTDAPSTLTTARLPCFDLLHRDRQRLYLGSANTGCNAYEHTQAIDEPSLVRSTFCALSLDSGLIFANALSIEANQRENRARGLRLSLAGASDLRPPIAAKPTTHDSLAISLVSPFAAASSWESLEFWHGLSRLFDLLQGTGILMSDLQDGDLHTSPALLL